MSKDSSHTYVHINQPRVADLFEEFNRAPQLPYEHIFVPAQHEPLNPEDEDDVVPDQHAAFGITRATQARREIAWRDLGLEDLVSRGPEGLVAGAREGVSARAGGLKGMGVGMRKREGLGGGLPR